MAEPGKEDASDQGEGDGDRIADSAPDRQRTDDRIARLEDQAERMTRALELLAQRAGARRRDWDAVAALVATFIGAVALAVSGYTAFVQRQQLRAQVWPRLSIKYSGVERQFYVTNDGTGPGQITAVRVAIGDTVVHTWKEAGAAAEFTNEQRIVLSTVNHTVLAAGKEVVIAKPNEDDATRAKFSSMFPGHKHPAAITVCYCSVLDECWLAGLNLGNSSDFGDIHTGRAFAPGECPIRSDEQFED